MRPRHAIALSTLGCLLLTASAVAAQPPPGSTCVSGYNPDAITNVCYKSTPGSTVNVPTVTTDDELCVIGDICVPQPGLGPSNPQPVPGAATPTYLEVNGIVLFSSDQPLEDEAVDIVLGFAENAGQCFYPPENPVATWARGYVLCVVGGV